METKQNHLEQVRILNEDIDKYTNECKELVESEHFQEIVDTMLLLEKRSRILIEPTITIRIVTFILEMYHKYKTCKELCSSVTMLSKRRAQSDVVILELVRYCTPFLDEYQGEDCFTLINTLLDISEGKMNIENERTHLVLRLVNMKEATGDIKGAAKTSQELTVEVCNTLSPREKASFLLEQIRLSQLTGDFFRVPIYISKMNIEVLNQDDMEDIKERYIDLCIKQHINDKDVMSLYKDYEYSLTLSKYTILKGEDETIMSEKDQKKSYLLTYMCLFLVLTTYSEEQMNKLKNLQKNYSILFDSIPIYKNILNQFISIEIIQYPLESLNTIYEHPIFTDSLFAACAEEWKELLRIRCIQHNILVLSKTFIRGTITRFSQLLSLSSEDTQFFITEMVDNHIISVKIDQLTGIIDFKVNKSADTILTQWSSDTNEIMKIVDKTSLLIEKEHILDY